MWILERVGIPSLSALVHFDDTVDLRHEPETCEKADRSCNNEEQENNDRCVAKVKEGVGEAGHLELGEEVMDAVEEEIDGSEATCQE